MPPLLSGPRALGRGPEVGCSRGPAGPDASIAVGYVVNRRGSRLADDPRGTALVNAVCAAGEATAGR
ncbi:hypothetical protein [Streptomyces sp. NPDC017524]|uniref:hypothetical protein n=1 Tax=unclassified Streptomyces TaxID=2593676 RepID=UPI0037A666FA